MYHWYKKDGVFTRVDDFGIVARGSARFSPDEAEIGLTWGETPDGTVWAFTAAGWRPTAEEMVVLSDDLSYFAPGVTAFVAEGRKRVARYEDVRDPRKAGWNHFVAEDAAKAVSAHFFSERAKVAPFFPVVWGLGLKPTLEEIAGFFLHENS